MWPRSSIPRVISMLRYTVRRSSRSRPASRTSVSDPTGSASRAIAMRRTLYRAVPPAGTDRRVCPCSSLDSVGKASDWLREERRKVLGDWVAVCLGCGFAQRYFEEWEDELPDACPQCGGEIRSRCP